MNASIVTRTLAVLALSALAFAATAAIDAKTLPDKKQTKLGLYMTAKDAHSTKMSNSGHVVLIDVRSRAEVNFLGMPTVADANIPYMDLGEFAKFDEKKGHYKLEVNSHFAERVATLLKSKGLDKNATVILLCRSGSRSAKAANLLADLGYKKIYSVVDGYEGDKAKDGSVAGQRVVNGWRNNKLPWTYKLDKNKLL